MSDIMINLFSDVAATLVSLFIAYMTYLLAQKKFSGWRVRITINGEEFSVQPLGVPTAKSWIADPWACKLGLKSCVSDGGRMLKVNVLERTKVDKAKREFQVTLMEQDLLPPRR